MARRSKWLWEPGWKEQFAELRAYKGRHGDCLVPQKWKENHALGRWVSKQRKAYKAGALHASQQERLEKLGFVWEGAALVDAAAERYWEVRLAELKEYKGRHGDCLVPEKWEENQQLARWVSGQRQAYKAGTLEASRQERLEGLGFERDNAARTRDVGMRVKEGVWV